MNEPGELYEKVTQNEREIRRLRLQMDEIASGGVVRGTSIGGVIPAENRPVEWWFNANLLGLGDELELLEGSGVWISGTFAGGRAYYEIGAYITGVHDRYTDAEAQAIDPFAHAGVVTIGDTNFRFEVAGNLVTIYFDHSLTAFLRYDRALGVWYIVSGGLQHFVAAPFAGVSLATLGGLLIIPDLDPTPVGPILLQNIDRVLEVLDFPAAAYQKVRLDQVFLQSPASAPGHALRYDELGSYPTGIDFLANDLWFGFGQALDLREGPGVWISGTMVGNEANYEIGAYGGGAGDAADLTYTPAVAADWDGDADPGNQDGANDQLAERVTDIEERGLYEYGSSALSVWGTSGVWQSSTPFIGSVNGNPTSTSIVYNVTSGETSIMRGMVLHNTTKGEKVYIEAVNYGTNTLTVEANSPDDADTWDNLDNITTASQTNLGRAGTFVDIDVSPFLGGANAVAFFLTGYAVRRNADTWFVVTHPYEAYDLNKELSVVKVWADDTMMFQLIVPLTKADGRHYFTLNLLGLAAANAATMGRWSGQFTKLVA